MTTMCGSIIAEKLTRREKEVYSLLVECYSAREIAEKLFISTNTAEIHRANILEKLNIKSARHLVREYIGQLKKGL